MMVSVFRLPSSMSSVKTQVMQLVLQQHHNANISHTPGMCLADIGCAPYNGHRNMINMFTLSTSSLKLQISDVSYYVRILCDCRLSIMLKFKTMLKFYFYSFWL